MIIMDQPLLSIIVFSIVMALIVFLYNLLIPGLTGRQKVAMSLLDVVFLAAFITLVVFLLKAIGFWPTLITGI